MPELLSFNEAIEKTSGSDRSLLLGNGFSARYFNYSDLLSSSGLSDGSPVKILFRNLGSVDFEIVIRSLEEAALVEEAYGNVTHASELKRDAENVRHALVLAINNTHPRFRGEAVFDYDSSAKFLSMFGKVFTLNYDLLLYWVNLHRASLGDGFGLGKEHGGFRGPFSKHARCEIYNIHGGLHLFDDGFGETIKALNRGEGVLAQISSTILKQKKLPLYVAEGTWEAKIRKINSVAYLRHCYDQLQENQGPLFVYGHSAADNDAHIYKAIFSSRIDHIFFGVHQPNEQKVRYFDGQLAKSQKSLGSQVGYTFYDTGTAKVWG